jgi:hypothetical protein
VYWQHYCCNDHDLQRQARGSKLHPLRQNRQARHNRSVKQVERQRHRHRDTNGAYTFTLSESERGVYSYTVLAGKYYLRLLLRLGSCQRITLKSCGMGMNCVCF